MRTRKFKNCLWIMLALIVNLAFAGSCFAEELFSSEGNLFASESADFIADDETDGQDIPDMTGVGSEEGISFDGTESPEEISETGDIFADPFTSEETPDPSPFTSGGDGGQDPEGFSGTITDKDTAAMLAYAESMGMSVEEYYSLISRTETEINPLYDDVFTEAELLELMEEHQPADRVGAAEITYYSDYTNAAAELRRHMVGLENAVQIGFRSESEMSVETCRSLFNAALEHTGVPKEGDSLRTNWIIVNYSINDYRFEEGSYCGILNFEILWYTTPEQDAVLDAKVADVLQQMYDSGANTEYEKICFIYRYICDHVTYDYKNLNEGEETGYKLHYTAYAALINGTSVCQGYSSLFYRLALEAGVDARYISGLTDDNGRHGWNIARIEGLYYNLDTTWDAGKSYDQYKYFLRCSGNFPDHNRNEEFNDTAFHTAYPMSPEDYRLPDGERIEENGLIFERFLGEARVTGYTENPTVLVIPSMVQGTPVTGISGDAFNSCSTLEEVTFPETLRQIEDGSYADGVVKGAFTDCPALKAIHFPEASSLTGIGYLAFFHCPALQEVILPEGLRTIGGSAFAYCTALRVADTPMSLTKIGSAGFREVNGSVIIRNANCEIYDSELSFGTAAILYGFEGSTARAYANTYDREFSVLEGANHSHIWNEGTVLREATCNMEGVLQKKCLVCGGTTEETIPRLDHVFLAWKVEKAATCTAEGLEERICRGCKKKETRVIPKTDHVFPEWTVKTPATCTADGVEERTCRNCQTTQQRAIAKTGHTFSGWTVVTPAGCVTAGKQKRTCSSCGLEQTKTIAAIGKHSFGKWTTVKKATVLATGKQQRVCSVCGKKQSRILAKLSPAWKLAAKNVTLKKGKKITKKMLSGFALGDYVKTWKSLNTGVAAVSGNKAGKCTIVAKKAGKSTITATLASGKRIKFTVTVKK